MKYVAYYRVSTQKQGQSGLGLEAQQEAVRSFLAGNGELVKAFTEVESGKRSDRPQLAAALAACRAYNATLVIAKLDRLARNVAFIATLMESKGVQFVACDNPHATPVLMHILAAIAEDEAKRISERTRNALAAAKARGTKLGGFRGFKPTEDMRRKATEAKGAKRRAKINDVLPTIRELQMAGVTGIRQLTRSLNRLGIAAPRGGDWHPAQVRRVLLACGND